jgi:hypothetical protein
MYTHSVYVFPVHVRLNFSSTFRAASILIALPCYRLHQIQPFSVGKRKTGESSGSVKQKLCVIQRGQVNRDQDKLKYSLHHRKVKEMGELVLVIMKLKVCHALFAVKQVLELGSVLYSRGMNADWTNVEPESAR